MPESTQHKLDRVRPPRVQITYDVEIGGAMQKRELPLVVGIMAELSGKPSEAPAALKTRGFVNIDRDNFNDVMTSIQPRLAFQVDNKIANDDSKLNVELNFRTIDDFEPVSIIQQVAALRKLFEARQKLSDLLTKLDGNDELDRLLQEIVSNTEGLTELKALGAGAPADQPAS
ncbi:MAG TPA: type VI secretion system contractile sheath small subunit [Gemmatimonadaceae bacterium]|nr:type VI secretion system contractile sheath small subunit [Gemmatimonadaceae bacterium]